MKNSIGTGSTNRSVMSPAKFSSGKAANNKKHLSRPKCQRFQGNHRQIGDEYLPRRHLIF